MIGRHTARPFLGHTNRGQQFTPSVPPHRTATPLPLAHPGALGLPPLFAWGTLPSHNFV